MRHLVILGLSAALLGACERPASPVVEAAEPAPLPALLTWADLTARPLPSPSATVRYAEGDAGVIDVWLPDGDGPHPVVLMIHGGCWQKAIADRSLMNYAAEDLRQRGLAVWNIEYRGVDEDGGGYPGTFLDVAAAVDALRNAPPAYNLNTTKIVAIGHSAGGHLAAWASARGNINAASPLAATEPVELAAVINSGGLADLEASEPVTLQSCLADIRPLLTGSPSEERPDVYSDTSASRLAPSRAEHISVNATRDGIAPPELGKGYTDLVRASGGQAMYIEVPGGHVELITPGTQAWEAQATLLVQLLRTE